MIICDYNLAPGYAQDVARKIASRYHVGDTVEMLTEQGWTGEYVVAEVDVDGGRIRVGDGWWWCGYGGGYRRKETK